MIAGDLPRFLVRALCDLSGRFQLVCELGGGQAVECRVGSVVVVIDPPFFDPGAGVARGQEPGRVQALLAEPAVERFDIRVIARLSRPREVQLDLVEIGPLVE